MKVNSFGIERIENTWDHRNRLTQVVTRRATANVNAASPIAQTVKHV
ncbi:MAG: hypothetical protein R3C05_01615 [Pirellulaceae bacterium]